MDLVFINHLQKPDSKCLDFDKAGFNITWGGNVRFHCMNNAEWRKRHVDFMCGQKHGWHCNTTQYEEVTREFSKYKDNINVAWRPFAGYIFRDLFPNPQNPFWASVDQDLFLGNFSRYPMNILSQLTIMTGMHDQAGAIYLAGQLTAYNFGDPNLGNAWKSWPQLQTPGHFTRHLQGKLPAPSDERFWSYAYLASENGVPGMPFSWCIVPDMNGDDYFDYKWQKRNADTVYIVSGREILLLSAKYTREQIEFVLKLEREQPIDDLGGLGWTPGEDGSQYLMDQPNLTREEVSEMAKRDVDEDPTKLIREGFVESLKVINNTANKAYTQYVHKDPLSEAAPPLIRTSLVRFAEMAPGYVIRRAERDDRHRGYERKLIRHHLKSKRQTWFELPPFDITENHVLRYNADMIEVFQIGPEFRHETLFLRKNPNS
jgi:hypothetical protein